VSRPIPIVVCIDVEPDARQLDPARPEPWRGFEALRAWVGALRSRLPAPAGPPRFAWFFRVDAQVAEAHGSPAWALTHYARDLEMLRSAGDELGLHSHAYRWDADVRGWIIDHGDQSWVERTVREAFGSFAEALGSRCLTFRFGDHWMNDATVRLLEALGARIDLTLEPGMPASEGLVAGERHTGATADLTRVPQAPYRPAIHDFRAADPSRRDGLWMMPVTTGRLPAHLRVGRTLFRSLTRAADASFDRLALNLALAPVLFRALAAPLLAADSAPCLVLPLRSDTGARPRQLARLQANIDYLLQHPARGRFAFCTPGEALDLHRG
jgi:hypothetical protein